MKKPTNDKEEKEINVDEEGSTDSVEKEKDCGIIMPIASFSEYTAKHWSEVKSIITDSARNAGYKAKMVSDDNEMGIIHKRIVRNIYENDIAICDISGKNPNVMLELGMRLAFDRPVIVIKDEKTPFSFDTSPLEHLEYPSSLRYHDIEEFKESLSEKIKNFEEGGGKDSFLKSFGSFKVVNPPIETISPNQAILEEISILRSEIRALGNKTREEVGSIKASDIIAKYNSRIVNSDNSNEKLYITKTTPEIRAEILEEMKRIGIDSNRMLVAENTGNVIIYVDGLSAARIAKLRKAADQYK